MATINALFWFVVEFLIVPGVVWFCFRKSPNDPKLKRFWVWGSALIVIVLGGFLSDRWWGEFTLATSLFLGAVWIYHQFGKGLLYFFQDNLIQTFLVGVFYLLVWGWLFVGLGIPDLIWHEDFRLRFVSAVSAVLLLSLFGCIAYYLVSTRELAFESLKKVSDFYDESVVHIRFAEWLSLHEPPFVQRVTNHPVMLHRFLWVLQFPFLLLLVLPALCPAFFPYVPQLGEKGSWSSYLAGLLCWGLGMFLGVLLVKLGLRFGRRMTPYTDTFAGAVGASGKLSLLGVEDFGDWLGKVIGWVWGTAVSFWDKLGQTNPRLFKTLILPQVVAARNWVSRLLFGRGATTSSPKPSPVEAVSAALSPETKADELKALFLFVVGVILFFVTVNLVDAFSPFNWIKLPPGPAIFSLIALFAIVDGLTKLVIHKDKWYLRFVFLVGAVVWIAWANHSVDKLRYEQLAYEEYAKVDLPMKVSREYFPALVDSSREDDPLVKNIESRNRWIEARRKALKDPNKKPKLVVICCSGGGGRSLAWTTTVLDRLRREIPDFNASVRLVSAGSAGSVGAGYYIKALYDNSTMSRTPAAERLPLDGWSDTAWVPRDSETTVVRSIAMSEVWRMFNAYPVGGAPPEDRGRVLEANWKQLRQITLEELRPAERAGLIPSLVLAPVTLEDGRRLLISNLDLGTGFNSEHGKRTRGLLLTGGPELLFAPEFRAQAGSNGAMLHELQSGRDLYPEFDLQLFAFDEGVDGLPTAGRNLIIVAKTGEKLRIRTFDFKGIRSDYFEDEKPPGKRFDVARFKDSLDGLWPPARPDRGQKSVIIGAVQRLTKTLLEPPGTAGVETNYSLTGVEFSRLYDQPNGFRLSTAARMSAALPGFTPAVYLPSNPPLRVIDSGFFDNYGVDIASGWLYKNRDWLIENTSGVLLVQIRALGRREDRNGMPARPAGALASMARGYQLFGSVLEGAGRAFYTGAIFRNDRQIAWLSELFNRRSSLPQLGSSGLGPLALLTDSVDRRGNVVVTPFFTTVVFENTTMVRSHPEKPSKEGLEILGPGWEASYGALTWSLTENDIKSIREAFPIKEPTGLTAAGKGIELIKRLQAQLENDDAGLDEVHRAAITWDLERLQNFERLKSLKTWWERQFQAGDAMPQTVNGIKKSEESLR